MLNERTRIDRHRARLLGIAGIALCALFTGVSAQTGPSAPGTPLPAALIAKLPLEWRQPVATLLSLSDAQQADLAALSDEALRVGLVRPLSRLPPADAFLTRQLTADPSSRVRSAIAQAMAADTRWLALPETLPTLERIIASDPDVDLSLATLETLRRLRLRSLSARLADRLAAAKASGDAAAVARLDEERERWINLERGTMLPAFLRDAPPVFSILSADRPVSVLAFGDFGTGSRAQRSLGETIAAYHRERPFNLAITLGDNFYDRGMVSPSDPRWQTWWEDVYGPLGITFYPALGNHDWGFPDSPAAEILYAPASKTWRMPASYYTFTAGPVQFFALDTQSVALSDRQLRWLDEEIGRSQATWKVVYGHHPIYSGGNYSDRPDLIARLLPLLRNRVDVYICGHDHNLQALRPEDGVRFVIAGGGGAGLYDLRPYERSVFASRSNGFAAIDANGTRLTVRLVDSTGKTLYEDVLTKGSRADGR